MMREILWSEKDSDTQLVLIWLRAPDGSESPPYAILAASLHLFAAGEIKRIEIIP